MVDYNVEKTSRTDLTNAVNNYVVEDYNLDSPEGYGETYHDFPNSSEYLSYYKNIPELKKAIDAFAIWTVGKGYEVSSFRKAILRRITGWGEDSFKSILKNLVRVKKYQGDAFAEIVRDDNGELLNLKPLATQDMRVVVDDKGIIKRYEQLDRNNPKSILNKFKPEEILHLCNDRVENEVHGTSVIEACKWVINARNEAMSDYRKVLHRNVVPVRVIEVDTDDPDRRDHLIAEYEQQIAKGEVLVIPKGTVEIKDNSITIQDPTTWIKYLENFFYQAVGIPRVIATSLDYTEAGSKIGYLTFEPIYTDEQKELEEDLLNQVGISIKFTKPPSLQDKIQSDEEKNTGQTSLQDKETSEVNMERE